MRYWPWVLLWCHAQSFRQPRPELGEWVIRQSTYHRTGRRAENRVMVRIKADHGVVVDYKVPVGCMTLRRKRTGQYVILDKAGDPVPVVVCSFEEVQDSVVGIFGVDIRILGWGSRYLRQETFTFRLESVDPEDIFLTTATANLPEVTEAETFYIHMVRSVRVIEPVFRLSLVDIVVNQVLTLALAEFWRILDQVLHIHIHK